MSLDRLDGLLMGVVGIAYADYMMMTFRMINAISRAYRESEEDRYKVDWERARVIAYFATDPHNAKKAGSPEGLLKFPWDGKSKGDQSGFAALKQHLAQLHSKQFAEIDKKVKNG